MKILVTGAGGNLGGETAKYLIENGHEVVATDIAIKRDRGLDVVLADLCDMAECRRLVAGTDAVVHLGNIPNKKSAPPEVIYARNTSCNYNMFHAAMEAGIRRIIYASSIQVYGIEPEGKHLDRSLGSVFPIDHNMPVNPRNWYALSKTAGEHALEFFARQYDISGVSLRFPMLVHWHIPRNVEEVERERFRHVWRFLTMYESARLIEHCLRADLPGHRAYLPVFPGTVLGWTPQMVIREFYPEARLSKPLEEIDTIIDISHITAETGWAPSVAMLEESPMAKERKPKAQPQATAA